MTGYSKNNQVQETGVGPLAVLEHALEAAPQDAALHRAIAELKRMHGDELAALAHLIAVQTLEADASGAQTDVTKGLCAVATGYFLKGDDDTAERWYRLVLLIDPHVASAYQNLCAIYLRSGRLEESERCRARAYQIQRVFIEPVANPIRRLLILCVGRTSGNIPFESLLTTGTSSRIKYAIDYAALEEDAQLPPYDLVFNAIGEPDVAAPLADRLEHFSRQCTRPVLNSPLAVGRTQRHLMPALLGDINDVVVAPCIRSDTPPASRADLAQSLARAGMALPVLVRPAATHGGLGLVCCETIEEVETKLRATAEACYLTKFHDYRSADGYFRKYRVIFIDREPFPYHLAISPQWMVHYFSADMENKQWKLDEEMRFLQAPCTALGAHVMTALAAIGRRLDLDYAGIDFTVLPDGRVFVFEANATMLVHPNNGVLTHKNPYVQRIVDAFEQLLARRTAA